MSNYSILLNTREPRSLTYHQSESRFYHDIWQMHYSQGTRLEEDQVSQLTRVKAQLNRDERIPSPTDLASASGRYSWSVQRQPSGTTRLEQRDHSTGEIVPVWQHCGWAEVKMASHPLQDTLVWSYSSADSEPKSGCLQWNTRSSRALNLPLKGSHVSDLRFSPQGDRLVFVHANEVFTHSLGSPACQQVSDRNGEGKLAHAVTHLNPQWSPDGSRIFYTVHSHYWRDSVISDSFGLIAALADGSQRRVLLENPAVADFLVNPK